MLKGLEAIKKIKWKLEDEGILSEEYELCDVVKKELKALEIIRNKNVDTRDLFVVFDWFGRGEEESALNDYNSRHKTDEEYNNITLTLEEFNLLKEVLGDE